MRLSPPNCVIPGHYPERGSAVVAPGPPSSYTPLHARGRLRLQADRHAGVRAAMSRVCVIGAGFGGLALAVQLQAAGIATTLVEARDAPGGRGGRRDIDGMHFDLCPATIDDPGALQQLWSLAGRDVAADVTLLPVAPLWRLNWPDSTQLDWTADSAAMARAVARLAPGDLAGYEQFVAYAGEMRAVGTFGLGEQANTGAGVFARALPLLLRQQAWRSLDNKASSLVRSDKLRQALSFRTLMKGGNPLASPALHAASLKTEFERGMWWPQGGAAALAQAMAALFAGLGGELRLGDPVTRIHVLGNRASEVSTASGWRAHFDAVASNADVMHTYRTLLGKTPRGEAVAKRLARGRWTPGVFAVHFALEGTWPGIPHNMMLFGPRWEGLLDDLFQHGVLPRDMVIRLAHPTVTDATLAPPGRSLFSAFVPVANLGRLPIDWDTVGPVLQGRVIDEIGRRLIPDIRDRIVTAFHSTPRDAALALNAHLGSCAGLEPSLWQSIRLRPRHRDETFVNLYLVGAGTHPGAGFGSVLTGARAVAKLIEDDLKA